MVTVGSRRKALYGATAEEARAKMVKLRRDLQLGIALPDDRVTVGRFLDKWLEDSVKPSKRDNTYRGYEVNVHVHIKPHLGAIRRSKLSPWHIETWQRTLLDSDLAPASVRYARATLQSALAKAEARELVGRNVVKLVAGPPMTRKEVEPFTPEQAQEFLAGVEGDRLEALYVVAFTLGLRIGEILGLRWVDVDLDAGTLRVVLSWTRSKGEKKFTEPKSERSRRTLSLPATTLSTLKSHRLRQLEERMRYADEWQDSGLVFVSHFGTPLIDSNVRRSFNRHTERLRLPHRRLHDGRRACASLLLALGVDMRVVMEILDHSQIALTANTYSHSVPQLQEDAARRMDALLAGSG